jgi:transcriptional regulatory protein RtcR
MFLDYNIVMKKQVVIGFLGQTLDAGPKTADRWMKWRPSVNLCMAQDMIIHRFDMLVEPQRDRGEERLYERVAADIASVSPETELKRHHIGFRDPWDFELVYAGLLDFVRVYPFDTDNEDYLVHITTGTHVMQICWFLLTEAHYIPGKLFQTSPARKNADSPGTHSIIDLDLSKYDRIASRFQAEAQDASSFLKSGIATRNAAFNDMIDQIEHVATRSKAPILLTGPTGAGKSQLAKRIYELKHSKHQLGGNFVEVNCATLKGDSAMSALFGHRKGAFTGAAADRAGLLKSADGGLLFLDEIGELGLDEQAMILRAIEEKRFMPMGSDKDSSSDFQLIAGTNHDLAVSIAQGRFREDLYARLNLWTFQLPALKNRCEDIEPNLDYELDQYAQREGRRISFNKEARIHYLKFATAPNAAWRGNFRDLAASVTRMATFAIGGRISEIIVESETARLRSLWRGTQSNCTDGLEAIVGERALDPFDRAQLAAVVAVCRSSNNLSDAGRKLFAVSRTDRTTTNDADRLRKYLARFDLDWTQIRV